MSDATLTNQTTRMEFICDVTPGGAYFQCAADACYPKDKEMFYGYQVKSLGWGYTDTVFVASGNVNRDSMAKYDLAILHQDFLKPDGGAPLLGFASLPVLHRVGEYVLISPNGQISGG